MRLAKYVVSSIAVAVLIGAACGPKKTPPSTPAPSAPAAKPATPPAAPPPQPAATPAPTTPPPAAAPATPPAAPAGAPGAAGAPARGGGGGRGEKPPTGPLPPAVMPPPATPIVSGTAPSPDPRVGLSAGRWDAGQAAWNIRMVSTTPPSLTSMGATHSDLAFTGKYAVQGNYNGFEIWDISNPAKPILANAYECPASQNDVSVYKNLLFMSSEATNSRTDCKFGGVADAISKDRVRGIRIFDISDVKNPKLVASVQTCRGSHTHTVVEQPGDKNNVYIYVSGTAGVRSADELPGCMDTGTDTADPNNARFRLEVIKVPLSAPSTAAIVSSPRIFQNLPVPPRNPERDAAAGGRGGNPPGAAGAAGGAAGGAAAAGGGAASGGAAGAAGAAGGGRGGGRGNQGPPTGPNQCHDIT
ncbi:MAG TPA: hypothetical protein VFQ80_16745, partial [Thermomicrobiales bacterium]|nr:hypothetical protein [Thermomicrobiales bacterium]